MNWSSYISLNLFPNQKDKLNSDKLTKWTNLYTDRLTKWQTVTSGHVIAFRSFSRVEVWWLGFRSFRPPHYPPPSNEAKWKQKQNKRLNDFGRGDSNKTEKMQEKFLGKFLWTPAKISTPWKPNRMHAASIEGEFPTELAEIYSKPEQ